jgi:hypothetical protein
MLSRVLRSRQPARAEQWCAHESNSRFSAFVPNFPH